MEHGFQNPLFQGRFHVQLQGGACSIRKNLFEMLLYIPRTESLKVKVQTKRQLCTEKQADPKHTKCSSGQPTTPFQHHIVQTISSGDKYKLESYRKENTAICMISSSHKCMYINMYVYIYIFVTYYLQPPNQPPKNTYYANILLTKKQSTINYPTNPKQNLFHIILIHLYPIPKTGHQLLRAFYGKKKTPFFFGGRNLHFSWFFLRGLMVPTQPTTSSQKFPRKGSVLHPTRRRAVLAHGRKRVVRGLQGHHVRQLGRPRMTGDPGMALIHLGPMGSMMIHVSGYNYNIPPT